MKYKKIVVLDSVIFYPEHKERLNEIAEEIVEYNTCNNEEEVLERVKGADCIISCWVDIPNRVIEENPQLKTIAFWTHAYEHRIDKNCALEHGIDVPSIPDYGTDSVAELVFIALLQLFRNNNIDNENMDEEIIAKISDDVRCFYENVKDVLKGKWIHEYIKAGQLKITQPEEIKEETLKGLTMGLLTSGTWTEKLLQIISRGFKMNSIYSLGDLPYNLNMSFRPIDSLLAESQIIIYDSRSISEAIKVKIRNKKYLSNVDISQLIPKRCSLKGKTMGIIGMGRIGSRVAQIAIDGFGMNVIYYSKTRKPSLEANLGLEFTTLEHVLTHSDIISFHLPHVGVEDSISEELIQTIPVGTIVINTSIGTIFQSEQGFLSRFNKDDLKGYVDVYRNLPPRNELKKLDNLLATYRLGWRTKSTVGLKTHKLITKLQEALYNSKS